MWRRRRRRRQFPHSITFAVRLDCLSHSDCHFMHARRSCTHHRTHHRPDFVSSALHCYFNLLQKEPKSSRGRHHHHVALYHIIWSFFLLLLVFLSNSSRHSHFIFRFFLHIITMSIRFEICNAQDANNNNNNRSIEKWYASARGNRNKGKTKLIINHRQCVRPLQRDVCGRTDVGSNNGHALARSRLLVWTRSYLFFCLFFVFTFLMRPMNGWRWRPFTRARARTPHLSATWHRVAELSAASNQIETIWYTFCAINALRRSNEGKRRRRAHTPKTDLLAKHFQRKMVFAWTFAVFLPGNMNYVENKNAANKCKCNNNDDDARTNVLES